MKIFVLLSETIDSAKVRQRVAMLRQNSSQSDRTGGETPRLLRRLQMFGLRNLSKRLVGLHPFQYNGLLGLQFLRRAGIRWTVGAIIK